MTRTALLLAATLSLAGAGRRAAPFRPDVRDTGAHPQPCGWSWRLSVLGWNPVRVDPGAARL